MKVFGIERFFDILDEKTMFTEQQHNLNRVAMRASPKDDTCSVLARP